jgi:phosphoribosyl-AMP cyclohydrolase
MLGITLIAPKIHYRSLKASDIFLNGHQKGQFEAVLHMRAYCDANLDINRLGDLLKVN